MENKAVSSSIAAIKKEIQKLAGGDLASHPLRKLCVVFARPVEHGSVQYNLLKTPWELIVYECPDCLLFG